MNKVIALVCCFLVLALVSCNTAVTVPSLPSLPSRRYYIGGSFNELKQPDGSTIEANNIAYFDDGRWGTYGNGTDGEVHSISVDLCRNVYVGGAFTTIDGVQTGPIAKYNYLKGTWEALGNAATMFTGVYNKVYAISSDCINVPNIQSRDCSCDVLIAGDFTMNVASGDVARNVAMFKASGSTWSSLGSGSVFSSGQPARAIYKREQPSVTDATNYIYVGGNFGLMTYKISSTTGSWETVSPALTKVYSMSYVIVPLFWKTDSLVIAGEFSFPCENSQTCTNLAEYDRNTKKFAPVGTSDVPNGAVYSLDMTKGDVYIGGAISSSTYNYMAYLSDGQSRFQPISGANVAVKSPVRSMKVCGYTDALCSRGSIFFTARDELSSSSYLAFYDKSSGEYLPLGNSTTVSGVINVVDFYVTSGANTIRVSFLAIVAVLSAIFMMYL